MLVMGLLYTKTSCSELPNTHNFPEIEGYRSSNKQYSTARCKDNDAGHRQQEAWCSKCESGWPTKTVSSWRSRLPVLSPSFSSSYIVFHCRQPTPTPTGRPGPLYSYHHSSLSIAIALGSSWAKYHVPCTSVPARSRPPSAQIYTALESFRSSQRRPFLFALSSSGYVHDSRPLNATCSLFEIL